MPSQAASCLKLHNIVFSLIVAILITILHYCQFLHARHLQWKLNLHVWLVMVSAYECFDVITIANSCTGKAIVCLQKYRASNLKFQNQYHIVCNSLEN